MDRMKRIAILAAALLASCSRGGREEAEQAVRAYLAKLVDAYRTSDASLMDPLVSEAQGLKLTGLIGVKRDAGVVLDAKILDIQFARAERQGDDWIVETKERWYYRDRKIGTGEQVGEDSTDSYAMRYRLTRKGGKFILDSLEFIGEPAVGRKQAPMPVDPRILHGIPGASAGEAPPHSAPAPAGDPPPASPAKERRP
jgi:hypothetical protein